MNKITLTIELKEPVRENKEWKKVYPNRFDEDDYVIFKMNCKKINLSTGVVLGLFIAEFNKNIHSSNKEINEGMK